MAGVELLRPCLILTAALTERETAVSDVVSGMWDGFLLKSSCGLPGLYAGNSSGDLKRMFVVRIVFFPCLRNYN